MSITIRDIMMLPCMKGAHLLTDSQSLDLIVSSISVLENSSDKGSKLIFPYQDYCFNEILLTSFHDIYDDVAAQCKIIRWLGTAGEIGFVLYYVGIIMPRVDQRLIDVCNEIGCALICMPENDASCRYGELLATGTQAILESQMSAPQLVNEVLSRMSRLSEQQNNMGTVFRMVCDRLHATLVLVDNVRHILYTATWPHDFGSNVRAFLRERTFPEPGGESIHTAEGIPYHLYNVPISVAGHPPMNLLIQKAGAKLSREYLLQIQHLIQLGMDIWANNSSDLLITELTAAIFLGDLARARELAPYIHFSLEDVNTVWILHRDQAPAGQLDEEQLLDMAKGFLEERGCRFLADLWEDTVVVLLCTGPQDTRPDAKLKQFLTQAPDILGICCDSVSVEEVAALTATARRTWQYIHVLFPRIRCYSNSELEFTDSCVQALRQVPTRMEQTLNDAFKTLGNSEYLETLMVYLLDASCSSSVTSELMNIHRNTANYRIDRISEALGFRPNKPPEMFTLYRYAAMTRLRREFSQD